MDRSHALEDQAREVVWQACQEGKYQHRFREIDKPFKMVGKLIRWVSICGRAYCYDPPMVNERIKRCRFCEESEQ